MTIIDTSIIPVKRQANLAHGEEQRMHKETVPGCYHNYLSASFMPI